MNLPQILTLVFAPSLYIVLSCCALAQFNLIFNGISSLAFHMQRTPALEALAPRKRLYGLQGVGPGVNGTAMRPTQQHALTVHSRSSCEEQHSHNKQQAAAVKQCSATAV